MRITETWISCNTHSPLLNSSECILDIETSGRFWRTAELRSVSVVFASDSGDRCLEKKSVSERESDEYELLTALSGMLEPVRTLITFNGNAFDLPFLQNKYKAYGLPDPFLHKEFRDLFLDYRNLAFFLRLPSRRLRDYAEAFGSAFPCTPVTGDAVLTLGILPLDHLMSFLDGGYEFKEAHFDEALYYTVNTLTPLPFRISLHDEVYHLIAEGNEVRLSVRLDRGKVRYYHTDTENYCYLPQEGYSVHRTMAEYVDRTRKEKAVRENCFHLVSYSDSFVNDRKQIDRYLRSVFRYLGAS